MRAHDADDVPDNLGPSSCAICQLDGADRGGSVEFEGAFSCVQCLRIAVADAARVAAVRRPAPAAAPVAPVVDSAPIESEENESDFCYACNAPIYGVGASSVTVGKHDYCWACAHKLEPTRG